MATFQELNRSLLNLVGKIIRYRHHVVFISTYIKYKHVPKGFIMKFHSNLPGLNVDSILKKCSMKLMEKTLLHYKRSLLTFETDSRNVAEEFLNSYPERSLYVRLAFKRKFDNMSPILNQRRKRKFQRDFAMDYELPFAFSLDLLNKYNIIYYTLNEDIVDEPSNIHHPILISESANNVSYDMKELCSKGPSFVPTPEHYDWFTLQRDFDAFRNRIRARFIFANEGNVNNIDQTHDNVPKPPKKPSNWTAPKTSSPEIETFLANIESRIPSERTFSTI